MKKLLRYLIISIIIVTIFVGLGYAVYAITDEAFLTRELSGGDMSAHVGIGFVVEKYYPLSQPGDPPGGSLFYIDFTSALLYVALFTGIQFLISICINRLKKKRHSIP